MTPSRALALCLLLAASVVPVSGFRPGAAAGLDLASQGLAEYRTCTVTATPSTTTAVVDASVRQASPGSSFGGATANDVRSASGANRRLYIRFDLAGCAPTIPASATVLLASLRLYVTGLSSACRVVEIHRVTSPWTEAGLTWANQPFGAAINNPPSGGATDSFTAGTPASCENRTTGSYLVGATPTSDVAAFVAGTATNHGWMLRDSVEGSGTARTETFAAKELNLLGQAPQLVITYVMNP